MPVNLNGDVYGMAKWGEGKECEYTGQSEDSQLGWNGAGQGKISAHRSEHYTIYLDITCCWYFSIYYF